MIDQSKINLLDLIGQVVNLEWACHTDNGEYFGPCPFCGEGHDRLRVWPNKTSNGGQFYCRQCHTGGDAIAFVMKYENVDFRTALRKLGLDSQSTVNKSAISSKPPYPSMHKSKPTAIALTSDDWQTNALQFVQDSVDRLWDATNPEGLTYLHSRGISYEVAKAAKLGFNPSNQYQFWSTALDRNVWLPYGIVIPWFVKDRLIKVNVRRLETGAKPKYMQAAGGTNGLYFVDPFKYEETILLTEGEFDVLALLSTAGPVLQELNIRPVATGSTNGGRSDQWLFKVAASLRVLVAFDVDDAGEKASEWWLSKLGERATRLPPLSHDISDMIQEGHDTNAWLRQAQTSSVA